jgi:glycosyltransferase involved in cell wall biosynthesis
MSQIKLSVIIPSYRDPYLQKTINSLLDNSELEDELEIIICLDGYWPEEPLEDDKRVKIVHLGRNRGMRDAINAGVVVSKGEYIMRMDEHQIVGKGYDRILLENIEDNWIVTPRRFFLDPVKWEVMDIPPIDYCDLKIVGKGSNRKFSGSENKDKTEKRKDVMIDEIQAMQGSCWFMSRKTWDDVVGELETEKYGPLIFDSHEMVFKLWKNGGKLFVNKNTWHAHKHRSFTRTHNGGSPENRANCEEGYKKSLEIWESYFNELKASGKL